MSQRKVTIGKREERSRRRSTKDGKKDQEER